MSESGKPPALGQWLNKRPPGKRRVMKPEAELVMMRDLVRSANVSRLLESTHALNGASAGPE